MAEPSLCCLHQRFLYQVCWGLIGTYKATIYLVKTENTEPQKAVIVAYKDFFKLATVSKAGASAGHLVTLMAPYIYQQDAWITARRRQTVIVELQ